MTGTVRLYRFGIEHKDRNTRQFLTAFEPEMKAVTRRDDTRLHEMAGYVFPHNYKPSITDVLAEEIPAHCFYSARTGEHFYTTSESEKKQLIERQKSADPKGDRQ